MNILMISAVSENNVIGNNNNLPWHIKEDLDHYHNTVEGNIVVMGRKTFESTPEPKSNTDYIVFTRNKELVYDYNNVYTVSNVIEFLEIQDKIDKEDVYISGGEKIYNLFLPIATELIISKIHSEYEGDTYFPEYEEENWTIVKKQDYDEFTIYWMERKNTSLIQNIKQ